MIESYSIDSEAEANYYLTALLKTREYRSANEIEVRAAKYIKSVELKAYFIGKGKEFLKSYAPQPSE